MPKKHHGGYSPYAVTKPGAGALPKDLPVDEELQKQVQECTFEDYIKTTEWKADVSKTKPSRAKAAGLKATFTLNPKTLLMTSFGRGNDAVAEKKVTKTSIESLSNKESFTAKREDPVFAITSHRIPMTACADDPMHSEKTAGDDMIHLRAKLETKYFKKTFTDNIHIQLIYSIMDIEKILAVHINNIIYAINNMYRRGDAEYHDIIGMGIPSGASFETFCHDEERTEDLAMFKDLCKQPQLAYFGSLMLGTKVEKGHQYPFAEDYTILQILALTRQSLAHTDASQIYRIATLNKENSDKVRDLLDSIYGKAVKKLNIDFLEKAKKNIVLLFRMLGITTPEQKKKMVASFYEFEVRKGFKNLGFSVKKLREVMETLPEGKELKEQRYDSVRQKINKLFDFMIFYYYDKVHEDELSDLVNKLRATTDEKEKEHLYWKEACRIWPMLRKNIKENLLPNLTDDMLTAIQPDKEVDATMLREVLIPEKAEYFSELIYLITHFLDGKEINDLLTTLIHKFECIQSFIDVAEQQKIPMQFVTAYHIFSKSGIIAKELRVINSFARMQQPEPEARRMQYMEAVRVLGFSGSEAELEKYVDTYMTRSLIHDFRNFIGNNVVESDRFKYIARYGNIMKLHILAENPKVIGFVLKDIPDTQITRYFNACTGADIPYDQGMRSELTKRLTGLNFKDLTNVKTKNPSAEQAIETEHKKSLVRLYLTVLYLLVKNMVYINSRYFMAFHALERDASVAKFKCDGELKYHYSAFAKDFLRDHPTKKRVMQYLQVDIDHSSDYMLRIFRNAVEHLGAVRNMDMYVNDIKDFKTYFELYHYVMQRYLADQYKHDCNTESSKYPGTFIASPEDAGKWTLYYFDFVKKHGNYCKDFVKAYCVPFAYNLPRFKNLSIDALFDKNRPGKPADKKIDAMKCDVEEV